MALTQATTSRLLTKWTQGRLAARERERERRLLTKWTQGGYVVAREEGRLFTKWTQGRLVAREEITHQMDTGELASCQREREREKGDYSPNGHRGGYVHVAARERERDYSPNGHRGG